jgi:hypothetical protein
MTSYFLEITVTSLNFELLVSVHLLEWPDQNFTAAFYKWLAAQCN